MAKGLRTRNRIIEEALKLARQNGLMGVTIGGLAKSVGMSKSGLFAHFNSKDRLQSEIYKNAVEDFNTRVFRQSVKIPRGEDRVCALFENWVKYLKESKNRPAGRVIISACSEIDDRPGPLRELVIENMAQLISSLEKAVKIAIEKGHFREDLDVSTFATAWYGLIVGFHHLSILFGDEVIENSVRQSFNLLVSDARSLEHHNEKVLQIAR